MDVRALRKEVASLEDVEETLKKIKEHWVKPIRSNTNSHLPFLQHLEQQHKKELNQHITQFHTLAQSVARGQRINQKLQHYSRYLVDLSLAELRGDVRRSKAVTNLLLHDEFLNIKGTVQEVKEFEKNVKRLEKSYHDVTQKVQTLLTLDESVHFMDLPHKQHVKQLSKTCAQQKKLVRALGKKFVRIARKNGA